MRKLTFGSLFSGIGGLDLGLQQSGMICKWQVEKDEKCLVQLETHWPDIPKYKDVNDVGKKNLTAVDLICGGFPCQDVSVSGRREGLAGERSGLWFEFHRIIGELKPEWVVIENVPGLLSSNGGRDMGTILGGLAKLGYWWAYRVLDAQFFGVPQRRRRVFIVASLTKGCPQEVLFEREISPWDTSPSREATAELAGNTQSGIGIGGSELGFALRANPSHSGDKGDGGINTSFVIDDHEGNEHFPSGVTCFAPQAGGNTGLNINEDLSGTLQENQVMAVAFDEVRLIKGDGKIVGALPAQPGMKQQNYIANTFNGYTGGADDNDAQGNHLVIGFDSSRAQYTGDIAAPLRVNGAVSPGVNDGKPDNMCASGPFGVRRLTPLECERLQGFPPHWTSGQSDSARYRQLGNAVCVPVAHWIGTRIFLPQATSLAGGAATEVSGV